MKYMTQGAFRLPLAALTGLLLALSIGVFVYNDPVSLAVSGDNKVGTILSVSLSTSTVPLFVSGVVQAADSTTIYAQTAGVITTLPAREGSVVYTGDLLSLQSTPVLDAELQLAIAQSQLSSSQESLNAAVANGASRQAAERSYSVTEIATIRESSNESAVKEAAATLLTTAKSSVLTVTDAINYVNNNRVLFSADGLRLYDEAVVALYGHVPNYFLGGVTVPVNSVDGLTTLLAAVESDFDNSVLGLEDVSKLANDQLQLLSRLFVTAEADVFNRRSTYVTDNTTALYLAKRAAVLAAEQSLQSARSGLRQALDNVLREAVSNGVEVTITDIDREMADLRAKVAIQIASETTSLNEARTTAVLAQKSLGNLTAPFSGVVGRVTVEVGQYVTSGAELMTLVGTGARELEVTVPAFWLDEIAIGQPLEVDGETVGFVERFSAVSEGRSGTVVVALLPEFPARVGSSVTGELILDSTTSVFVVPRKYVHFDSDGPYICYESGFESRVSIVYDTGSNLYLEVRDVSNEPLVPASSVSL